MVSRGQLALVLLAGLVLFGGLPAEVRAGLRRRQERWQSGPKPAAGPAAKAEAKPGPKPAAKSETESGAEPGAGDREDRP